ncbi:MAG: glycosyltransferase family 39 protein [Chloroflexi bacterium]|nr:glycosyltransferase family 39 protein [Chloroflexota bacterium]
MLPYWINSTLAATPGLLWMFVGVGLPWALLLLPRADRRQAALVAALTLATGPALLTAWMFVLGSVPNAALLRTEWILGGSAALALAGWGLVWRVFGGQFSVFRQARPALWLKTLVFDEKLIMALIVVALAIRWLNVAYWPHMAYDEMWVYGYQGRLYTLVGNIPAHIGYYPQFLPLQFSYLQIVSMGGIDDHAARAVLPYLHLGSILAAYVLGARLFNRRTGFYAAAIWAFYPHVGEWSRFGDLEIPLAFLFTLAAAFFLLAWRAPNRRYALLAGFVLGIALWTKPTAGAFVWGVLLLLAADLLRVRLSWRAWLPRFGVAFWTGLACIPLGGVWYVRNVLLGHAPLVLPEGFWLTQAARSGSEFGWLLLAGAALLLYLAPHERQALFGYLRRTIPGVALVLLAVLPSLLFPRRMLLLEYAALAAGAALLWWALRPRLLAAAQREDTQKSGWLLLLALPYFVTWFYSYSYHYRLSFAIVPLLIMPTALVLARWLTPERWLGAGRRGLTLALLALAFWGIVNPLYDRHAGWMWDYAMPTDFLRYESGNWALMRIVFALQEFKRVFGLPLNVAAPGVQRLPFFFPLDVIDIEDVPTRLEDLRGRNHYVYSFEGERMYRGVHPLVNEVAGARALNYVMISSSTLADNDFLYELYYLDLDARYRAPAALTPGCTPDAEVLFGGFALFYGCAVETQTLRPDAPVPITLYWHSIARADADYMIAVHLVDAEGSVREVYDGPVARADDRYYYSTLFWAPAEYVQDRRTLSISNPDTAAGAGYRLVIAMYRLSDGARVPVTIDGAAAGDSYTLEVSFVVER